MSKNNEEMPQFALKTTIALLLIMQLAISCSAYDQSNVQTSAEMTSNGIKYLALGDSYTIGESVAPGNRFPVQLQKGLETTGIELSEPEIIARTGWTTDELAEAIAHSAKKPEYRLVTLLIGVNNQYRGRNPEEYREQFRQLLRTAVSFAGNNEHRVIVLSIPDYGYTPFGAPNREKISREIDVFNQINLEETRKTGAHYVDITPISRRGLTEPTLVAADRLHPSAEMYRLWVELLLPKATEILKGP